MSDRADKLIQQWQQEIPELKNLGAAALIGRFALISTHLDKGITAHHKDAGLAKGEFDVLASLRRAGHPYVLSPTDLYKTVMLTSGAMTNRLDKLENKGLIQRIPNDQDRRSNLVQLTEYGIQMIEPVIQSHLDFEQQMLEGLSIKEQRLLNSLLKKWLNTFEPDEPIF